MWRENRNGPYVPREEAINRPVGVVTGRSVGDDASTSGRDEGAGVPEHRGRRDRARRRDGEGEQGAGVLGRDGRRRRARGRGQEGAAVPEGRGRAGRGEEQRDRGGAGGRDGTLRPEKRRPGGPLKHPEVCDRWVVSRRIAVLVLAKQQRQQKCLGRSTAYNNDERMYQTTKDAIFCTPTYNFNTEGAHSALAWLRMGLSQKFFVCTKFCLDIANEF